LFPFPADRTRIVCGGRGFKSHPVHLFLYGTTVLF
jgi:hypothetical protein